jgi:hypothetical protein
MSKLSKLITNPALFFRDFLLKRHPIDFVRLENKIEDTIEIVNCSFPIDIVYTWVDSDDTKLTDEINKYKNNYLSGLDKSATSSARWKNHDELKFSLRSVYENMPWVNNIFIVTNGQRPKWLNTDNPKIHLINHNEILNGEYLPTFNSHTIGSALHNINNLSEHYIYFNDDIFLNAKLSPEHFFTVGGDAFSFISNNELDFGPPNQYDIPTVKAAKNARKLISEKTGYCFNRRMAHMYHPQLKSVNSTIEKAFIDHYHLSRLNKFRSDTDILVASFMYPYMGYLLGKVHFKREKGIYIKIREKSALEKYNRILNSVKLDKFNVICANDYIPPNFDFEDYHEKFNEFLLRRYPFNSPFEVYS